MSSLLFTQALHQLTQELNAAVSTDMLAAIDTKALQDKIRTGLVGVRSAAAAAVQRHHNSSPTLIHPDDDDDHPMRDDEPILMVPMDEAKNQVSQAGSFVATRHHFHDQGVCVIPIEHSASSAPTDSSCTLDKAFANLKLWRHAFRVEYHPVSHNHLSEMHFLATAAASTFNLGLACHVQAATSITPQGQVVFCPLRLQQAKRHYVRAYRLVELLPTHMDHHGTLIYLYMAILNNLWGCCMAQGLTEGAHEWLAQLWNHFMPMPPHDESWVYRHFEQVAEMVASVADK